MAVLNGIVDKSGSWFSYQNERIGQGRENAKEYLENNPEVMMEIEKRVREAVFAPQSEVSPEDAADELGEEER